MNASRMTAAVLALTALTVLPAQAGVEYVTAGNCTKVWSSGQGEFSIIAGPNVRFTVFGNSVDLINRTNGFRVDGAPAGISARLVSLGTACGDLNNTGFAVVEVDSPLALASNVQLTLGFRMPLGDWSSLPVTIKPFPQFNLTWSVGAGNPNTIGCITKTGTIERLDQDTKLRITLPAGHQQDQTTCNQTRLGTSGISAVVAAVDINPAFRYSVTGVPAFMTATPAETRSSAFGADLFFTINVAGIRSQTAPSNSTITVRSRNPALTRTLILEVVPNLSNGFTQTANCRSRTTGDTVDVENPLQCELRLARPPAGNGQPINFLVQLAGCVKAEGTTTDITDFTYSNVTGEGRAILHGPGTIFEIPFRTNAGSGCASTAGVEHNAQFFIGPVGVRSGANFTQDTFRIRQPRQ